MKKNVIEMYAKYVGNEVKVTDINIPLKVESFHQRDILERKVFLSPFTETGLGNEYGVTKLLTLWAILMHILKMCLCQTSLRESSLQTTLFYFFTMKCEVGKLFV